MMENYFASLIQEMKNISGKTAFGSEANVLSE